MSKSIKIWLIAAAILVLVGGGMAAAGFSATEELNTQTYQTTHLTLEGEFDCISVNVDIADVTFVLSEDETCKVECFEEINWKHEAKICDGTLVIESRDNRKWYEHIGISIRTPEITVYLPEREYTALSIVTATGNISIPSGYHFETVSIQGSTSNIECYAPAEQIEICTTTGKITIGGLEAESLRCSSETGRIVMRDISCGELILKSSTGALELTGVIAGDHISAETKTGSITLENCDAGGIAVKTSTGNVKGTLLSEKIFITETSTGNVSVPKSTGGGKCEITTTTGNIEILQSGA